MNGKEIDVFVTHLSLGQYSRKLQLEKIAQILGNCKKPFILTGDFNEKNTDNLKKALGDLQGLSNSYNHNTAPSWNPSRPLDLILLSKEFRVKENYVIKDPKFSDHLPLISEVYLK